MVQVTGSDGWRHVLRPGFSLSLLRYADSTGDGTWGSGRLGGMFGQQEWICMRVYCSSVEPYGYSQVLTRQHVEMMAQVISASQRSLQGQRCGASDRHRSTKQVRMMSCFPSQIRNIDARRLYTRCRALRIRWEMKMEMPSVGMALVNTTT